MEADSAGPIDDLLGHRGWVLALARSLVARLHSFGEADAEGWHPWTDLFTLDLEPGATQHVIVP